MSAIINVHATHKHHAGKSRTTEPREKLIGGRPNRCSSVRIGLFRRSCLPPHATTEHHFQNRETPPSQSVSQPASSACIIHLLHVHIHHPPLAPFLLEQPPPRGRAASGAGVPSSREVFWAASTRKRTPPQLSCCPPARPRLPTQSPRVSVPMSLMQSTELQRSRNNINPNHTHGTCMHACMRTDNMNLISIQQINVVSLHGRTRSGRTRRLTACEDNRQCQAVTVLSMPATSRAVVT